MDTNLNNLQQPTDDAKKRRHSVKPATDLMINDSQSNISGDSSTKSGKLGMLFQNINRKIRQKIEHSNSMKLEAKRSSSTTDAAAAVMPPPLQDYVKKQDEDSDDVDIEFSSDDEASSPAVKQKHIKRIVSDYKSVNHLEKMHSTTDQTSLKS